MSNKILSKKDAPSHTNSNEKRLGDNDFIVSKTDTKGRIIYCNEMFTKMVGYPASDIIGANHNLVRHPDTPRIAFKIAWELIENKKEFFGFIKNLCSDGGYYWVFAYVTADLDASGKIISYTSVRRRMPQSAINTIVPIYKSLVEAESRGGMDASQKILNELLKTHKLQYNEFVINLQKGATL